MQRDIIAKLNAWKASEYRKPLILKGARQVGKTWALKEFGRTSYRNFVYLTLEEPSPGVQSEYAQFFEGTRDPRRIISNLSLALGQPIEPGETLLIIDEIQDCPSAVGALKYFCDEAPEYHVACAGSLLGVRLSRETSAFPVGKVEFMEMRPMSFSEFLKAEGAANYDEYLGGLDQIETVPDFFHVRLVEHLRRYFACGGMPEALGRWVETGDIVQVDKVLSDLLDSYERDFAKHGGRAQFAKLSQIWNSIPAQLARENKSSFGVRCARGLVLENTRMLWNGLPMLGSSRRFALMLPVVCRSLRTMTSRHLKSTVLMSACCAAWQGWMRPLLPSRMRYFRSSKVRSPRTMCFRHYFHS